MTTSPGPGSGLPSRSGPVPPVVPAKRNKVNPILAVCLVVAVLAALVFLVLLLNTSEGPFRGADAAGANTSVTATSTEAPSSGSTTSPSASTTSATPSEDCSATPSGNQISVTLALPAGDPAALDEIEALRGSKYGEVMYNGEAASADEVKAWIHVASCNGMSSMINLDPFMNNMSDDDAKALIREVSGEVNLSGFVVSQNGQSSAEPSAINARVQAIKSATNLPVACMVDFVSTDDPQDGIEAVQAFQCDQYIPVYLPWQQSDIYGPVSAYTEVAQQAVAVGGPGVTAAVQAFDWGASEPDTAEALGFTETGLPPADQVGLFAGLLDDAGVHSILVYSEEPAADDADYLRAVGDQVAANLGQ